MRWTVRTRLLAWLLLATMPVIAAGVVVVTQLERNDEASIEERFSNLLQLEKARINSALTTMEIDGVQVAANSDLLAALERHATLAATGRRQGLTALAEILVGGGIPSGNGLEATQIVDRAANVLGQSSDYSWTPDDDLLVMRSMEERRPLFGNAFVTSDGDERLALVVPVIAADGSVLGALAMEHRLGTVVDLAIQLEDFGATTEAVVVQPRPDGDAEVITIRRFDRDAAFNETVEVGGSTPSGMSVLSTTPQVVHMDDYRGEPTVAAITTIPATGWGLAVKIDTSEAFELSNQLTRSVYIGIAITMAFLLGGWALLVQPLARRLRRTAAASDRVASGDYESRIDDTVADEIGEMARSIDRLAGDLDDDIAARRRAEDELRFQATHDKLTGLVNRQHATTLIDSFGTETTFSVLFLDLDGFKAINDTYGHGAGDEVLIEVGRRLTGAFEESATVARWGGDEFVVILADTDAANARLRAQLATDVFNDAITTGHGDHRIGTSVGVATSSRKLTGHAVLVEADTAMYTMKREQPGSRDASPTVRLIDDALDNGNVEVMFQPVVRHDGARLVAVGAEALVRVRTADGVLVPPGDFLPALGSGPTARALDAFVMRHSIEQLATWRRYETVPSTFRMAVNAGVASILDPTLSDTLATELARCGVEPSCLLVEIPETVENVDASVIDSLRSAGVLLAIDDVGVRHSNLERLVDLAVDVAKIDRRWIPELRDTGARSFAVLRDLIAQCQTLGLDVIAEGIETRDQAEMLSDLGVEKFQGFFFGRPMSAENFEHHWGVLTPAALDDSVALMVSDAPGRSGVDLDRPSTRH
ncbi:MAG: putative bifunctional diguanylate cyclase/phosphodiesterase [Ilumatobacter sp.]